MFAPPPGGPPPGPPNPPKPGPLPPPTGLGAKLVSVEDEPDDPTRLMDRRPPPPPPAAGRPAVERASIFNAPTKILPRVRSGGVLREVGANLLAYTRRPGVNLALLLLAGLLLVGLGFVMGSTRKEQQSAPLAEPRGIAKPSPDIAAVRAAPTATTSAPVSAIAVSSLPLAPPLGAAKEQGGAARSVAGSSAGRAASPDFPLPPDRPPAAAETSEPKKGYVAPIRNPGF